MEQQPIASLSDEGAITFTSPGTEDNVDLSKTILVVRAKVTNADRTDLANGAHVGVVNSLLHNLFKQVGAFLKDSKSPVPCISGNPSQSRARCKEILTHFGTVLQRYGRQNGHSQPHSCGC